MSAPGLPAAGDLTAVAVKRQFLDQIGDGLADGGEPDLHMAVRCDVRHTPGKSERMREGIVQINLGYTLLASLWQWGGATPHATECIEAN